MHGITSAPEEGQEPQFGRQPAARRGRRGRSRPGAGQRGRGLGTHRVRRPCLRRPLLPLPPTQQNPALSRPRAPCAALCGSRGWRRLRWRGLSPRARPGPGQICCWKPSPSEEGTTGEAPGHGGFQQHPTAMPGAQQHASLPGGLRKGNPQTRVLPLGRDRRGGLPGSDASLTRRCTGCA